MASKDSWKKLGMDLAKYLECAYAGRTHNKGESLECVPLAKAYKKLGEEPDEFCLGCRARALKRRASKKKGGANA